MVVLVCINILYKLSLVFIYVNKPLVIQIHFFMSEEEYSKRIAALKNGNATGIDDALVNKCQNISSFVLQFSYMVGLLISYWVDFVDILILLQL